MKLLYKLLLAVLIIQPIKAQQNLSNIINESKATFTLHNNQFKGDGWEIIKKEVQQHNNILIGEDHFFNEIPLFVSKLIDENQFDNFFCEIDPYSASLLQEKITNLSIDELQKYNQKLSSSFSFYALQPEFNLLKQLTKTNTKIIGTDQIVLTADGLITSKLKEVTKNNKAKQIYADIIKQSAEHITSALKQKGSFYFFTKDFENKLKELEGLELSALEKNVINDLKLSKKIYTSQSHKLRIQLMKNNILKNSTKLTQKNLFKYGAIHVNKAESVLGGYDIGNLVYNISDANFKKSLHIMLIGKEGEQGAPFKGMSIQKINSNSKHLKPYEPLFNANSNVNEWVLFDTKKIVKSSKKEKITINDETLLKTLQGFDYIIVIPKVSAADFIQN